MSAVKLTVRKSDALGDWYVIERAEHDGRTWLEPIGQGRHVALRTSSRFSDADVEGTAAEMLAIAEAIEKRGRFSARRCSVVVSHGDVVVFSSPRNSTVDGFTSLAEADALAKLIRETVKAGQVEPPTAAQSPKPRLLWHWRAWTANRTRIADCGDVRAVDEKEAKTIAQACLGGPHAHRVVEFQVVALESTLPELLAAAAQLVPDEDQRKQFGVLKADDCVTLHITAGELFALVAAVEKAKGVR